MATIPIASPTLDMNGFYPFRLSTDGKSLELDLGKSVSPHFLKRLRRLAVLEANGQKITPSLHDKLLRFPLPANVPDGAVLTLMLRGQPVSQLMKKGAVLESAAEHALIRLAISETRVLGLEREITEIPYARKSRRGFTPERHAPLTDLHTHASAQIKAEDLLTIAEQAGVAYPVELLKLLAVPPEPGQRVVSSPSFEFTPLRDEGLQCEQGNGSQCDGVPVSALNARQREAVIRKMHVAADGTMLFSDFDREMYRYRNPLVKNPVLTKAMIKKIAEDYAAQGIEYAELSTGSMLNPQWFKAMAEAVEDIERDGVGPDHKKITIRFLVGLPRHIGPQETLVTLKKIQYLARHPAIAGIDLLGYESNKTSDFQWALAHMAQWARASENTDLKPADGWDFKRDFTIRVHAGETGKNPENVKDAIAIAKEYGVRVRVAHALRAKIDAATRRDIKQLVGNHDRKDGLASDYFAFEMCPDSNQVYMTNTLVHDAPIKERIDQAPLFLGTDGGGAIATTPLQLAFSAIASGVTLDQLAQMRANERGFIDRQHQREYGYTDTQGRHVKGKREAFAKLYGEGKAGLDAFLKGYAQEVEKIPRGKDVLLDYLPCSFTGKVPVLIAGASGSSANSSWNELSDAEHRQVRQIMQLLVRSFDPKKVYFVLGRVQKEGVSRALDIAVREHNKTCPAEKFDVLGRYAGADSYPTGELAESISWVQHIPTRETVPGSMLNFLQQHKGHALFFGGSDFTSEMAKGAAIFRHIPLALMVPEKGIMADTAKVLPDTCQFRGLDAFIVLLCQSGLKAFLRNNIDVPRAKKEAIMAAKKEHNGNH